MSQTKTQLVDGFNINTSVPADSFVIDGSGNVGIGTSAPASFLHVDSDNTYGSVVLSRDGGAAGRRPFGIGISGATDANLRISASTDTSGANAFATQLVDITADGKVGIGTTSPGYALEVKSGLAQFAFSNNGTNPRLGFLYNNAVENTEIHASSLKFHTGGAGAFDSTERARIDSSGNFMVGCTVRPSSGNVTGVFIEPGIITIGSTVSAGQDRMRFETPSGRVGSITTSGSSTSYNTSSDYRLKENVVPLTGAADRLKLIPVHRFNFIDNPSKTVDGFLAHEAQAVVPECATGTKDEVDADGNPVYQGIDQSKLVPLLTAALQEALAEIESLKARVTALEP